jgi:hypothetical protein
MRNPASTGMRTTASLPMPSIDAALGIDRCVIADA